MVSESLALKMLYLGVTGQGVWLGAEEIMGFCLFVQLLFSLLFLSQHLKAPNRRGRAT